EDPHILLDLPVRDSKVVRRPALRRETQLIKDVFGSLKTEMVSCSQALGKIQQNGRVCARVTRRVHSLTDAGDPSFRRRHRPVLFFMERSWKNEIRVTCRFIEKKINGD